MAEEMNSGSDVPVGGDEGTRVVFFGSTPFARRALEMVLGLGANVVGVCAEPFPANDDHGESVWDFCKNQDIDLVDPSDVPNLHPDVGLAVRYNRILPPDLIGSFRWGVYNTHGGLLPEYRGYYSNVHALVNGEERFGATLHYIDEGVDTGDIVASASINVEPEDTGLTLHDKGEKMILKLLERHLKEILSGPVTAEPQDLSLGTTYRRSDIDDIRCIPYEQLQSDRADRIIRALDSPRHEPAFVVLNGKRAYIRYSWGSD